jgi:hypothetical protein
MFELPKQ